MNKKTRFLNSIPFFGHLSDANLDSIAKRIRQRLYYQNDVIFNQGDEADGMYIILFGDVEVIIDGQIVKTLETEDFFGEIALITADPRNATIRVISENCSTLFLSRAAFEEIKYKISPEDQQEILKRIQLAPS